MKVTISELRSISENLFVHLEKMGLDTIDIENDFYWVISEEKRYNAYNEPKEFTLGQLTDDWSELKQILQGENEPIAYALAWLSSILRVIGEKVVR